MSYFEAISLDQVNWPYFFSFSHSSDEAVKVDM